MRCALSSLSGDIGIHLSPMLWEGRRVNYYANKIFIFSSSHTYFTHAVRGQAVPCLNATNHLKSKKIIYLGVWPLWFWLITS